MAEQRYARVIVDVANAEVDRVFDYIVPEGMALEPGAHVMVPFGPRTLDGFVVELREETQVEADKLKPVLRRVEPFAALRADQLALATWMRETYQCTLAEAFRLMLPAQARRDRIAPKTQLFVCRAREGYPPKCTALQRELLDSLAEPQPLSAVRAAVARALEKKGYVSIAPRETLRAPYAQTQPRRARVELNPLQEEAFAEIDAALSGGGGRFLLYGVTGSGKTEVYMRAVARALELGRGAIVLVPEIALTPQMVSWFRARFANAAVIHSRLSAGERYDEWRRVASGEARVVVGARSAVFSPVENLGLIVVDEEHEHTYRSERWPCYDARRVAQARMDALGGVLVLGSATPEVSTFMRAQPGVRPENRLTLLELSRRANGAPLPEVRIVDMRRELARGNTSIFSGALANALRDCLAAGRQAILFINRRGYSTFVSCRACGHVEKCEACDLAMTYHRNGDVLACHYCGRTRKPPQICPECGSRFIKFFGAGTQKVEEEVRALFPQARVLRADWDTTRAKDAHERIFEAFAAGEADVLIGTQMIAKWLDFPRVTLVGAVAADTSLNAPDYRAGERTFQLITQVAGRAGRAGEKGLVILQTYEPDSPVIQLAARQDFRAFYERERVYRRRALYPPYSVILRLVASAPEAEAAAQAAQRAEERLRAFIEERGYQEDLIHMHAKEAPVIRLDGLFRYHVFLKLYARGHAGEIQAELERLAREGAPGVRMEAEVNPTNMM